MSRSNLVFRRDDSWRPLSYRLDLPAEIREFRSCRLDILLLELSVAGCGLWAGFKIRVERPITLFVEGFAPIKATTAWSDSGFAELLFDQHLHLSVVQHMARESATYCRRAAPLGVPSGAHAELTTLSQELGKPLQI
jgi:hypothetical protein